MRDGDAGFQLREAVNVADLKQRDALVRRVRKARAEAVLGKATIEHWNRAHPEEEPISTEFWDATIAWCDGLGPLPTLPDAALRGEREG